MSTSLLHNIDQGMKLRLEKEGKATSFDAICTACFKTMSKTLSNASYLSAEQTIQQNFKTNLWKSRLTLIRHARNLLALREYAEAAVCYEKYLKIIEYVYEKKRTEFSAQLFKEHPREVTLITSALWSLVEIYDLHENYWEKQHAAALKLGEMMSYTNLFTSIVKRATLKRKTAKNPAAYKALLKTANVSHSKCFIASVAYPDRNDPTVTILRQFRNQVLARHPLGRSATRFYYSWSPGLANRLQHSQIARFLLRLTLPWLAAGLKWLFDLKDQRIKR